MNKSRGSGGFTLVELMAALAVVVMLGLTFAGALPMLRNKALQALCASNLRNCHLATMIYIADNNGFLPPNNNPTGSWDKALVVKSKILDGSFACCPACAPFQYTPAQYAHGNVYASDCRNSETYQKKIDGHDGVASNVILFADSINAEGQQTSWGFAYADYAKIDCRHEKRANLCFMDGHIEALSRDELISRFKFNPALVVESEHKGGMKK